MATTPASIPRDWREGRRFRAWALKRQGWSQRLIAAALGVTSGALPSRARQPAAAGDRLESPAADPARDPTQRGGQRRLVRHALAGPQQGAARSGQTRVWVDESGCSLLPAVVRTSAPRTRTPLLRVPLTRDHLSASSGITLDDRLFLMVQERPFHTSPDVVRFLQRLLRHLPGKLWVIWDGAPIHSGQPVKDFLASGGAARLQLEVLPGYAPDLNPDEGIWNYLKRVELPNRCCATLRHLRSTLRLATARLRHKRSIIHSCFHHAGYRV